MHWSQSGALRDEQSHHSNFTGIQYEAGASGSTAQVPFNLFRCAGRLRGIPSEEDKVGRHGSGIISAFLREYMHVAARKYLNG